MLYDDFMTHTRSGVVRSLLAVLGLAAASPSALAQFNWTGDRCLEGAWTIDICWCDDCNEYPDDPMDNALISRGEPTIDSTINLLSLTTQQQASVLIAGSLNYFGSNLTNAGQVRLLGGRIRPLTSELFFTLGGPGVLLLDGAGPAESANITAILNNTLINDQGHTIRGRGLLTIPMMNLGTIDATGDLRIALYPLDNTGGLLKSSAAQGRLRIDRTTCTGGLLQSDAGVINLVAATLRNARLRPGNGELAIGDFLFQTYTATSTIDAVTLDGNSRIINLGELDVQTPCTNNGVMHVNGGGRLRLILPGGALVGSGSVLLEPGPDPLGTGVLQGNRRGQGPLHTIRGSGTINNGLENQGTILANLPGKQLLIMTATGQAPAQYGNRGNETGIGGVIGAAAGGHLRIEDCTISQLLGGLLRSADAGSRITTSNSTIDGGAITSTGGGEVQAVGSNRWGNGLRVDADVTVLPGSLTFFGVPIAGRPSATINGRITVSGTETPSAAASIELPPDGLLEGTGSIFLAAPSEVRLANSRVAQSDGSSTIGPGITIYGSGQFLPSNTTLQGTVRAEGAGRSLVVTNGSQPLITTGTLAAAPGATLVLQSRPIQNIGGVLNPSGGRILLEGASITGGTLQGTGTLDTAPGQISAITNLLNQGTIAVRGGSTLVVIGVMQNDGLIQLHPDAPSVQTRLQLNAPRGFTGAGEVHLISTNPTDGLQLLGGTATNGVNHTIRGPGRILGSIDNSGTLATGALVAEWPMDGAVTLRPSSRLRFDLAGSAVCRISAGSTATLAGHLEVVQTSAVPVPSGTTLTLLTASSITGAFTSTVLPAAPLNQRFSIAYTPTSVVLRLAHAADFDGDNMLSVADIFSFLNAWFSGALAADFNQSGAVDVQDIFGFLNAWFAG